MYVHLWLVVQLDIGALHQLIHHASQREVHFVGRTRQTLVYRVRHVLRRGFCRLNVDLLGVPH